MCTMQCKLTKQAARIAQQALPTDISISLDMITLRHTSLCVCCVATMLYRYEGCSSQHFTMHYLHRTQRHGKIFPSKLCKA